MYHIHRGRDGSLTMLVVVEMIELFACEIAFESRIIKIR